YHISDVTVDGASVGAVSSYTFTNVTANHTIAAAFGGLYYSQGSLAPNLTSSWSSVRGSGGTPPTSFTSGDMLVIQNGHNMTTTAAWNVTGSGASIEVENGGTLTATLIVSVPTFQVDNGGTYVHNAVSGTNQGAATDIPGSISRSFGASSTVQILKWASGGSNPVDLPNVAWGNLTINVGTLSGNWNQAGNLQTVNGNLTIQATGGGTNQFQITSNVLTTLNVAGNYTQSGGYLAFSSSN